jgi:hypothetical protein
MQHRHRAFRHNRLLRSKDPLTNEEAAFPELPLVNRTSTIVAKAAAIATNIVERIGRLMVRSAAFVSFMIFSPSPFSSWATPGGLPLISTLEGTS